MASILFYPFLSSFFGIDIGDTGIHYTNFIYIYSRPDIAGYSTVLTSIVGNAWLSVLGDLGIWGLNFLEVFIEWGMALLTYFLLRDYCGKIETLMGILIAVVSSGCYLNIFNYHQFTVFLILLLLFFVFQAIKRTSVWYSVFAGAIYTVAVFARFSNLACIVVLTLYLYGFADCIKCIFKHIGAFFATSFIAACFIISFLKHHHILCAFFGSVLKLKGMAQTDISSYSMNNLIDNLIWNNMKTFASPMILIGAAIMFAAAEYFFVKYRDIFCKIIVPGVLAVISVLLVKFSYDVNPAGASPQFTTGYNFMFGIFACFAIGMFLYEHLQGKRELALLAMMSMLLPILVIAGSNVGSKHIIISIWLVAPLFVFGIKKIWKRIQSINMKDMQLKYSCMMGIAFVVFAILLKFCHMVYHTNNFESLDRTEITETIIADNFRFLHTTEREREALDSLTLAYQDIRKQDASMVVFGTGVGIYALLESEPYIRANLTENTYTAQQFNLDLHKNRINPDVIFCKTNQYFGYGKEQYEELVQMVKQNAYTGKKQALEQYLIENQYKLVFENDYYCLFSCNSEKESCSSETLQDIFY